MEIRFLENPVKNDIINSSIAVFSKEGLGGTTMVAIAKAAKISKQRLVYHYNSPNEILAEIARVWGETGRNMTLERLAEIMSDRAEDKIVGLSDALFMWMKRYPKMAKLTPVLFHAVGQDENLKKVFNPILKSGRERIVDLLKFSPKYRKKSERQIHLLASGLHSIMMGTALYIIGQNAWDELEMYNEVANDSIRSLLDK